MACLVLEWVCSIALVLIMSNTFHQHCQSIFCSSILIFEPGAEVWILHDWKTNRPASREWNHMSHIGCVGHQGEPYWWPSPSCPELTEVGNLHLSCTACKTSITWAYKRHIQVPVLFILFARVWDSNILMSHAELCGSTGQDRTTKLVWVSIN